MRQIESIVIVQAGRYYKAHLRFKDPKLDEDVTSVSLQGIYSRVDNVMYAKDRPNYLGKAA